MLSRGLMVTAVAPQRGPILIVEDDRGVREALDVLLGDEFDLRHAANVDAALRLFESTAPSLVFLDIRLQGESGLDFLRRLGARSRGVPVVMVTAAVDEGILRESRALGAAAVVRKPFDVAEVEAIARASARLR
ncbi:MAG TPA: response regulator [Thermodesulfobacteriota bacterium]